MVAHVNHYVWRVVFDSCANPRHMVNGVSGADLGIWHNEMSTHYGSSLTTTHPVLPHASPVASASSCIR